jgi:hypothetical protein
MTFDDAASALAHRLRIEGSGFLTLSKTELKNGFQIGVLTPNHAARIAEALESVEVFVWPHPSDTGQSLRIYDLRHALGKAARAIACPDGVTDAPITGVSATIAREVAARDLRLADVPWLEAFGMLLELVLGREPDDWEDLKNDRHPVGLARELARALRIDVELLDHPVVLRLAGAASMFRPPDRLYREEELATDDGFAAHAGDVMKAIQSSKEGVTEHRNALLHAMAKLVLRGGEPPKVQVEIGALGLRRRPKLDA